ncbi:MULTISPECIES: transporter substrate-binding domain-containing protein [unclassified Chelatococcus]|uniref:substrate-binding periplasmic protein n=1 Tax=unclassified Chelatococcus TaxID=2638111 RepID=UPI001BD04E8B|nr:MULTISPECIES: transporter substrate-binding domain-containing protein [unclassified Chelatococcus]MBS7743713.1 amino acid ABC transporter substrate-binding protein [Chelatococcus sp. HY11]MBX3547364.1 amino acid ABC transporter substrate-binding protein [Chelatococcus sp.]CAH1664560.1 Amino acid ABC transporter substrate-binding protein (PAAT family) [Hyphomicrobiales bacterium]CAH1688344.1 Amino acid ABC transporter substrate-binding protein (PAAT family) [Hyphomicrobiales bacterium]
MRISAFIQSIVLAFALAGSASIATAQDFRVAGDPNYRPFGFTDENGNEVGYDMDFAAALGEKIGRKTAYEGMAFDGVVPALMSKRIDAITSLAVTNARKEQVLFSQPVLVQDIVAILPVGKPVPSLEELKALRIGVQVNSSAAAQVEALGMKAASYNSLPDELNDLVLGRLDAVVVESIGGAYTVAATFHDKLVVSSLKLSSEPRVISVAVHKDNGDLLAQIDQAITTMKTDGTMKAIATKWFGETNVVAE